jgi:hypothetical protein
MMAAVSVPAERREALARARAAAVRDALVREHGIAESRVRVGAVDAGSPGVLPELAAAGDLGGDAMTSVPEPPAVGAGPREDGR